MATLDAQSTSDNATQPISYAHGYHSAITRQLVANRTATIHAAFFLPYLRPGMSVLDCGCGAGGITLGLAETVAPGMVTGIDKAAIEIERAQQRLSATTVANVRFAVGDLYQLDCADQSFDAVFAHNVLEHIQDPARALQEMRRVLKPNGVIGLRDVDRGGDLLAPADLLLQQAVALLLELWRRVGGHPNIGRQLRGLVHEAGFADIKATASQEVYGDTAALHFMSQIGVSRYSEPEFVEQLTRYGLATLEQIEQIKAALLAWPQRMDAFFAIPHCEVVGWKV